MRKRTLLSAVAVILVWLAQASLLATFAVAKSDHSPAPFRRLDQSQVASLHVSADDIARAQLECVESPCPDHALKVRCSLDACQGRDAWAFDLGNNCFYAGDGGNLLERGEGLEGAWLTIKGKAGNFAAESFERKVNPGWQSRFVGRLAFHSPAGTKRLAIACAAMDMGTTMIVITVPHGSMSTLTIGM